MFKYDIPNALCRRLRTPTWSIADTLPTTARPQLQRCPRALPHHGPMSHLGGAATFVPARKGATRHVSALRTTFRLLLEPSRWLLYHSLHYLLELRSFRCLQFLCEGLSGLGLRIQPNYGPNKNHPNTSPTQRRGCHRDSSNNTHIIESKLRA